MMKLNSKFFILIFSKTAAEFGSIQCLEFLLECGKANPMERNMTNNWVPLHEAAFRDQYTCVNVIFN